MRKKVANILFVIILFAAAIINSTAASINGVKYIPDRWHFAVTTDSLVLRDDNGKKIAVIPEGTMIFEKGTYCKDTRRIEVQFGLSSGNVVKGYSKFANALNSAYCLATDDLVLRDDNGKKITVVPKGAVVQEYGIFHKDTRRVKITYGILSGNVVKGYLKYANYYTTVAALNLRNNKGEYLYTIPKGSLVAGYGVSDTDPNRLDVSHYGNRGTVVKSHCEKVTDALFTSIGYQKVTMIKNNKMLCQGGTVTGHKGKTDTPTGKFNIEKLKKDVTLRGYNANGVPYAVKVKYWNQYDGLYGFHDKKSRTEFGGTVYERDGSLGCPNVDEEIAAIIYNNAYVGMDVYIAE